MRWSFSQSRSFRRCQRQWFIKNHVANARADDASLGREAFLLSKLGTIYSWRGRLVDQVISTFVVPALSRKQIPTLDSILDVARSLFDRQRAFGLGHRLREPGLSVSRVPQDFAAFREIEYGEQLTDGAFEEAWDDVHTSFVNFLQMGALLESLHQADTLAAQRTLQFELEGLTETRILVLASPDLLALYHAAPPLIVDWKVHAFASTDYRLQLGAYALALTRTAPHQDFPIGSTRYSPSQVCLIEAQLLRGVERRHKLDQSSVDDIESHIARSAIEMDQAARADDGPLTFFDFPVTRFPETCGSCPFERLCWDDALWHQSRQTSLL